MMKLIKISVNVLNNLYVRSSIQIVVFEYILVFARNAQMFSKYIKKYFGPTVDTKWIKIY